MTQNLFIFGMGFTASHLAEHLRSAGWQVHGTRREADGINIAFDDRPRVLNAIETATHILSSVPPEPAGRDSVIECYGDAISRASAQWIGYLSSTGVYGDSKGGWVDETAPILGRRAARNAADQSWQSLDERVRIFRLPGIYGPGRSALDRVAGGKAHRIDLPEQIFSRVHVYDIVCGIIASFSGPAGVYNLADDYPCDQNTVIEAACDLLNMPYPSMQSLEKANLSPAARAFYAENRRVANGKAKRLLGWQPRYPTYRAGLAACMEMSRPTIASAAPLAAKPDQT